MTFLSSFFTTHISPFILEFLNQYVLILHKDLVKLRDVKLEKEPENKTEILKEHDKAVFCLLEGFKKC